MSDVMTETVRIIIATYGDPSWQDMALEVAVPSALGQGALISVKHGATLAEARNSAAVDADTDWLIFLDADDSLALGYVAAMLAADGDLRAPALHLVQPDGSVDIPVLEGRDMSVMNQCAIGTMIRRQLFLEVGGFWEERAWEDWSLFRRCWLLGASIMHVPDAVYVSKQDPAGRNSTVGDKQRLQREIIASHNWWLTERKRSA